MYNMDEFLSKDKDLLAFIDRFQGLSDRQRRKNIYTWNIDLKTWEQSHGLLTGEHLFNKSLIDIDKDHVSSYFDELLKLMNDKLSNEHENIQKLINLTEEKKINPLTFLNKSLDNNIAYFTSIIKDTNIPIDFLTFTATLFARPYREKAIIRLKQGINIHNEWDKSYCPGCGHYPSMAVITKRHGYRRLWCFSCNTLWTYPVPTCPFCGCQDEDKINYILIDDYPGCRLITCDNCDNYLKTIVEKYFVVSLNMDRLFLTSSNMDNIAIEESYKHKNILSIPDRT